MVRFRIRSVRSMTVVALAAALLQIGACASHTNGLPCPDTRETVIFAQQVWYLDRPEPEQVWQGVLEPREVVHGPNTRDALRFALVTPDGDLPVYAAGVENVLSRYSGQNVSIIGRWVDLSAEGFSTELWIGTICLVDRV